MPERLAHQCHQAISSLPEINRLGCDHHLHSPRKRDHVAAFTARRTASNVALSAPLGTRTVTVPIATSISRGSWSAGKIGAWDSTITAANAGPSTTAAWRRASRRQPNNCCGVKPCRRATALTDAPLASHSATISAFCSAVQLRRRPAPVKTSSRRGCSDLSKSSVSDMCLAVPKGPSDHRSPVAKNEGAVKTPLTVDRSERGSR